MNNEFLQQVAFCTAIIIGFAFMIGANPFKRKTKTVTPRALWTARENYMFIESKIISSKTCAELDKAMVYVENFKDKRFRVPISKAKRDKYYERLLQAFDRKVNEFEMSFS